MASGSDISEADYQQYLEALLSGDRARCSSMVLALRAAGAGLQDLYLNLFQRSLYQVGDLWETHRLSVAVEHRATALTERLLALVQPEVFAGAARERTLVIACVAREYHQLGGAMAADLAELNGWRGHFLGSDVSTDALQQAVERLKPDLLGLSLSLSCNLAALLRTIDAVSGSFPGLPVLVGGQALQPRWGLLPLRGYPEVRPVVTLEDFQKELSHDR